MRHPNCNPHPPNRWRSTQEDGTWLRPPHRQQIKRVRYNHDACIDEIIANPSVTQRELAAKFGLSEGYMCLLTGSDAFQARLSERRATLVDPLVVAKVEARLKGLATLSADIVAERLAESRDSKTALKTLEVATRALGYGARPAAGVAIQNNFVVEVPAKAVSTSEWAQRAREGLFDVPAAG